MTLHKDETGELAWLAFQYVTDELSVDAAEEFEDRLSCDQAAREALAEAVLLTQALAVRPSPAAPATAARQSWPSSLIWAALGAAACLAIVVGGGLLEDTKRPAAQRPVVQQPDTARTLDVTEEELALAWANVFLPSAFDDRADNLVDDDVDLAAEVDQSVSVPGWMVEAVHGFDQPEEASGEREDT